MLRELRILGVCLASFVALQAITLCGGSAAFPAGPTQPSSGAEHNVSSAVDLTDAVVFAPAGLSRREKKAVAVLIEEVEARTGRRWRVQEAWPGENRPVIVVASETALPERARAILGSEPGVERKAEGFQIRAALKARVVVVAGSDERGLLFGVGRLLRELRMNPGRVLVPADWAIATAPRYPIRGHQLGYRPKTNSYDGWDITQWDRYIRELAVFGANSVELIPPRSDDAADSPHFPREPIDMLERMSRVCDEYGLDVWLWNAALEKNYADPAVVSREMAACDELFRKVPRLDAVFVPGGDPGHTAPSVLMPLVEKEAAGIAQASPARANVGVDAGLRQELA